MNFTVYILYSEKNKKYYVGSCQNIEERLNRHNTGRNKSTHSGMPWKLMYQEHFDTRANAVTRENVIKKMKSKKYIEKIISLTL
ncbi:MAG: excinuclease ABC subunit C [Chitinophagaceae bacterium BSSC1]|nr:MAG: excinuclease ABC subunit C [Chitinophagaceae bacterium BSSC1]